MVSVSNFYKHRVKISFQIDPWGTNNNAYTNLQKYTYMYMVYIAKKKL